MSAGEKNNNIDSIDQQLWNALKLEQIGSHIQQYKEWLIYLLLLACISHAYDLFNFTLSIDDEFHAQTAGAKLAWAEQSRWGMYLANFLVLPDTTMPFVPMLVAVVMTALSVHFVVRLFSAERGGADYVAAPLLITCPTLYYVFSFETLGYGIGVGFFLGALGVYCLYRQSGWVRLLSLPLLTFTFGIYQAFSLYIAALFLFFVLGQILNIDKKEKGASFAEIFKYSIEFLVIVVLALAASHGMNKLFVYVNDLPHSNYIGGFVNYELSFAYLQETWDKVYWVARDYYMGTERFYPVQIVEMKWLFIGSLVLLIYLILSAKHSLLMRGIGLLTLALLLLCPYLMHFMNSGHMPSRSLLAIPVVLAGMVFYCFQINLRMVKFVLSALVVVTSFRFIAVNHQFSYADHMAREIDRELAVQIMAHTSLVADKLKPIVYPRDNWPVVMVGHKSFAENPVNIQRNTIGASYFSWGGGDVRRVIALMRLMGYSHFRAATLEQHQQVMDHAVKMPNWPELGAVDAHEGILIIKLGDYIAPQINRVCGGKDINESCTKFYTCKRENLRRYCAHELIERLALENNDTSEVKNQSAK